MEKNKGHFSAYPGRLAPPEARPAHIACRSQERSSQSGTHPRPSLKTLRQIQTFAVCKCKKPNYRKISKKAIHKSSSKRGCRTEQKWLSHLPVLQKAHSCTGKQIDQYLLFFSFPRWKRQEQSLTWQSCCELVGSLLSCWEPNLSSEERRRCRI